MLDPLQERIARLALSMPGAEGLALAGGGAMLAHGLVDRPTQDVDLFSPDADIAGLASTLVARLSDAGFTVAVEARGETYARLTVTESSGGVCKVELARDARIRRPVHLEVGPVVDVEEIAADKVLALFDRAAARDFVDVAALLRRFDADRLLRLAAEKDRGFDLPHFAHALRRVQRFDDEDFAALGLAADDIAAIRADAVAWADALDAER